MSDRRLLSIIIALYNEQDNIHHIYKRVTDLDWNQLNFDIEFIFVDDHSSDQSNLILRQLSQTDQRVKWLRFSRNFGSHKAFTAGLEHCTGDAAVILAADLQDPPETIPQLLEQWLNGAKVVWAVRKARPGEPFINIFFAELYYALMRKYAVADMPKTGADYFLIDRLVIDALKYSPERHTSLMTLIQWMGFHQASIEYVKQPRRAGQSKWNFSKRIKLAIDSFIGFSYAPIRAISSTGIIIALLGFTYATVIIARWFLYKINVEGWTSLMCVVLIISGVQLIMLGVLGEYLWRNLEESRSRPRYLIEASHGLVPNRS
jgi:dolichol-phosphate mannosyltransferase